MNNVLHKFWRGDIIPHTDCRPQTPEIKRLSDAITQLRGELCATMKAEQRQMFDALDNRWSEYETIMEEAVFSYAFALGMNMAFSVRGNEE